jgi:Helix-turn-helix domain
MAESEFWTVRQAREYLGVAKKTMARLIKEGTLTTADSPLDKRVKMVRRADVEALKASSAQAAPRKNAA